MQICKRNKTNYYKTPEYVKQKLYSLLDIQEKETGNHISLENMTLFDPCAGDGTLLRDVKCKKAINWDLEPRAEDVEQHDSLSKPWPKSDMVVMNPPFDIRVLIKFIRKWKAENNSRYLLVIGNNRIDKYVNIFRYTKWEGLVNLQDKCALGFIDRFTTRTTPFMIKKVYLRLDPYLRKTDCNLGTEYRYIKSVECFSTILNYEEEFFTFDRAKKSLRPNSNSKIYYTHKNVFKELLEYLKLWATTYKAGSFLPVTAGRCKTDLPAEDILIPKLKTGIAEWKVKQEKVTKYIEEITI